MPDKKPNYLASDTGNSKVHGGNDCRMTAAQGTANVAESRLNAGGDMKWRGSRGKGGKKTAAAKAGHQMGY